MRQLILQEGALAAAYFPFPTNLTCFHTQSTPSRFVHQTSPRSTTGFCATLVTPTTRARCLTAPSPSPTTCAARCCGSDMFSLSMSWGTSPLRGRWVLGGARVAGARWVVRAWQQQRQQEGQAGQ